MESYYHSSSALFKTLTERLYGIVEFVQLSVNLNPNRLKGSLCGMTAFPPYRRRITLFSNLGKLPRRPYALLFSDFGYPFGNLFSIPLLAVFKKNFSSLATEYSLTTLNAVRYWSRFILMSKGAS